MNDRIKYPRTPHVPSSPGATSDDKRLADLSHLLGQDVVITEKMDGENTSLYAHGYHARSLDSAFHPSRARLAALHGSIAHQIKPGWRICGENVFARHSIAYESLPSHFLAFSVWDDANRCLSWEETMQELTRLSLHSVPLLWRGTLTPETLDEVISGLNTNTQEGVVLRRSSAFKFDAFPTSVAKWVRTDHVQSGTHWRNAPLIPNGIAEEGSPP